MKRSKKLYVLLGVLVFFCIATFVVSRIEEHQEKIKNSDEVILEIASDTVTALSWENEKDSLAFHKDENWIYDEDEMFPVDKEMIAELLGQFESFGVSFVIEEVEDYGLYGLDDPICTISLTTESETYEVALGDYSAMDSKRYVSIGDGNAYLVNEDPLELFDATLDDMLDYDETLSYSKVNSISFAGTENYTISYVEESTDTYCEADVYFINQNGKNLPLDTENVESYLSKISGLNLLDYVTYHATDDEMAAYGLDEPELCVTVDYEFEDENGEAAEETFVLFVSQDPTTKNKDVSGNDAEDAEIKAYVCIGDSKIIYEISSDSYKALMAASYDDLRHEEIIATEFSDITQIDITLEGSSYTITTEGKEGEYTYFIGEEEIDIENLRLAMEALDVEEFSSESYDTQEEIRFVVSLNNENISQLEVVFRRYDGEYCVAVMDGETVGLISRSCVVDFIEAVHEMVL